MCINERDDRGVRVYLHEIGQVELLTTAEEIELAKRIKAGDEGARQLMIRANLRLVVKIAGDYAHLGLPLLDLISEGNIGLMKAVERFDPTKGGKLSTYAAWWIKQSIRRALANQSKTVRLPSHLVDKLFQVRRAVATLTQMLGREPTVSELASKLGVTEKTVRYWQLVAQRPASIDAPITDESSMTYGDTLRDTAARLPCDVMDDRQVREDVRNHFHRLDEREQIILTYRYGLNGCETESLEKVGARLGITRERVRQLQILAVKQLHQWIKEDESVASSRKKE